MMILKKDKNNSDVNNNNPADNQHKKFMVFTLLCYIQVVFASTICFGCILNLNIICSLLWGLVAIIFVPQIKDAFSEQYLFIKKYIIPIRAIVLFLALVSMSTL